MQIDTKGIMTPLGNVVTDVDRDNNVVRVGIRPRDGVSVIKTVTEDGIEFRMGRRLPKRGDEVSVNGTTVEVEDSYTDPDGTSWVVGGGNKHRWE